MERNDHLIGKQLGTCVLERVVGSGGMGMVYLAHQTRPVRDVAVKVLRSGAGLYTDAHQEFLVRFRREANVIARLDHINILPIYGYDEQDGLAYLVMPYLTGGSLRDLLEKRGKLSPQEAFKYIEQAGEALQYAHEHQIVHRDIKPGNMLFHADGRLVLADFGIARIVHDSSISDLSDPSITAVGQFLGSAEYMAPEMVQGHKVDHRVDLYELGIVLFQMLVGRVPFQGATVLSIAAMHINETPRSLTQLNPSIPRALDAVVQKVLSKNPEDRYASAREFIEAVRIAIIPPAAFLPNSNHYPGSQPLQSSSLDNQRNPFSPVSRDTHYQFETSNKVGSPANIPWTVYENPLNIANQRTSQTSAPANASSTSRGGTPYSPAVNTASENLATSDFNVVQHSQASNAPYNNSVLRRPQKSRFGLAWIVALCIIIALSAAGVLGVPAINIHFMHALGIASNSAPSVSPTVQATATLMPSEKAKAVVQLFYSDINSADLKDAYSQLSVASQKQQTYPDFLAGYAHTRHDNVTYGSEVLLDDGSYKLNVTIQANNIDDKGIVTTNMYTGYYVVGLDNGELKILPATRIYAKT